METVKIDVPIMPGYKCLGFVRPAFNLPCHYLDDNFNLIEGGLSDSNLKVCYRKLEPKRISLESTGEIRFPKQYEWYRKGNAYTQAGTDEFYAQYEIYRIVEGQ
jgi:hypothetical protein